jgi:hypothetical protein
VLLALAPETLVVVEVVFVPLMEVDTVEIVALTEVYRVELPIVLVVVSEPEVMVVSTASVLYALDEADSDTRVTVPEATAYKVVLPRVLVVVLDPEVMIVTTASVVYGIEEALLAVALAPCYCC